MKLCKDCKFYYLDGSSEECSNPILKRRSCVNGEMMTTFCQSERSYGRCGPDAILFALSDSQKEDDVIDWRDIKRDMDAELERDRKFDAVVERRQEEARERRERLANDPEAQQGERP